MGEKVVGDVFTHRETVGQGGRKVDAAVEPRLADFFGALPEAGVVADFPREAVGGGGERKRVAAIEMGEDDGGGAAEGAVAGDVFREGGSVEERHPGGISDGGVIGIAIGANGSDRAPKVVGEFGIPTGNGDVGHGDVEDGEEADSFSEVEILLVGDPLGYVIPMAGGGDGVTEVAPEAGNFGLFRGADGAGGATESLDSVEVVRVSRR